MFLLAVLIMRNPEGCIEIIAWINKGKIEAVNYLLMYILGSFKEECFDM